MTFAVRVALNRSRQLSGWEFPTLDPSAANLSGFTLRIAARRMRWIAMADQIGFDINAIDVHFIPGTFKISQMRERIVGEIKALACEFTLVVIDTSAAYFEGDDENSSKQASEHARRLRSLTELPGGPCVIVACHPPKNAGDDNMQPRGSGGFIAEVDGNLTAINSAGGFGAAYVATGAGGS